MKDDALLPRRERFHLHRAFDAFRSAVVTNDCEAARYCVLTCVCANLRR